MTIHQGRRSRWLTIGQSTDRDWWLVSSISSTIWSPWLYKDKAELEKVQRRAARFVCNNYDPVYSVTAMIDQLNWQKLENHRNNSHLCLLFKIMQCQIHVPTDDIPPPASTTTVDLEIFGVKKLHKAQTSTKLKNTRFFTMTILLLNN